MQRVSAATAWMGPWWRLHPLGHADQSMGHPRDRDHKLLLRSPYKVCPHLCLVPGYRRNQLMNMRHLRPKRRVHLIRTWQVWWELKIKWPQTNLSTFWTKLLKLRQGSASHRMTSVWSLIRFSCGRSHLAISTNKKRQCPKVSRARASKFITRSHWWTNWQSSNLISA